MTSRYELLHSLLYAPHRIRAWPQVRELFEGLQLFEIDQHDRSSGWLTR